MRSEKILLGLAGTRIEISCGRDDITSHISTRYGSFEVDGEADYKLFIDVDPYLDQSDPNTILVDFEQGFLRAGSSSFSLEFFFDGELDSGNLSIEGSQIFIDIENALRILVAHIALEKKMLLVHAAAFSNKKRNAAGVFPGYSGQGKTTISNLAADARRQVVSDDIVLIDPQGKSVSVFSTPLASQEGPDPCLSPKLPVSGIFFIEQATENSITELAKPDALMRLASVVPFNPKAGTERFQKVLEIAARIIEKVPCFTYSFVKDSSAISFLEDRV